MTMKKKWLLLAAAVAALMLSGCGTMKGPKVDLSSLGEVHAIVREEGSGTKNEFERLVNASATKGKQANSTEEAVKLVAGDKDAIAYVAYDAVKNPVAGVKVLSVDAQKPTEKTISNGSYPLTRTYYLCYLGEASPAVSDLLTFAKGAGQGVIPAFATPLRAPVSFLSNKPAGTLTIEGSTSVAPLMKALLERYTVLNPNLKVTLTPTDSSKGLNAAINRKIDLAMSSRNLKQYESELLTAEPIARDGIAIIVNEKNPLTMLTKEQIKDLFSGKWKNWKELD